MADETITADDLSIKQASEPKPAFAPRIEGMAWQNTSLREIVQQNVLAVEREVLSEVLRFTGGNKARAARLLQVDYKTIHTKAKKFGIQLNGGNNDAKTEDR